MGDRAHFFMNGLSDSQIIQGMLSEDERVVSKAIKYLYKTCSQMITRIVCSNGGNVQDAEDLVQEVILNFRAQLISGKFEYRDTVRISTYIYRMAVNQWITVLSRKNADIRRIMEFHENQQLLDRDPLMIFEDKEETSVYQAVFSKLTPIEQELLKQYYDKKKTLDQITEMLNIKSVDAAKMMKHRTMLKLRKLIKQHLGSI